MAEMLAKDVDEVNVLFDAFLDGHFLNLYRHGLKRLNLLVYLCHYVVSCLLFYLAFLHLLVDVVLLLNEDLVDCSVVSHRLHDFSVA